MQLADKACVPCTGDSPKLSIEEAEQQLAQLDGWNIHQNGKKEEYLYKEFALKNFVRALELVNKIGDIAEAENHHPDLKLGWGYVHVTMQTHSIGGLHDNDFIIAARIDKAAGV